MKFAEYKALQRAISGEPAGPNASNTARWGGFMKVVAGRLINELSKMPGLYVDNLNKGAMPPDTDEILQAFGKELTKIIDNHRARDETIATDGIPIDSWSPAQTLTFLAAILYNFQTVPTPRLRKDAEFVLASTIRKYAAYAAAEEVAFEGEGLKGPVLALQDMATEARTTLNVSIQSLNSKFTEMELATAKLHEAESKLETQTAKVSAFVDELNRQYALEQKRVTELTAQVDPVERNLENFRKAIEAKYQIAVTRNLWSNRATRNQISFFLSAVALAILLIVLPLCAILNYEVILLEVGKMLTLLQGGHTGSPAAQTAPIGPVVTDQAAGKATEYAIAALNRLIFVAFPLGLYIWLVRLVVRFNNRSLLLMDDANARQALMDTFYRISTDGAASATEREMMLTALFRPLPGQQTDSADFPTAIELVQRQPAGN